MLYDTYFVVTWRAWRGDGSRREQWKRQPGRGLPPGRETVELCSTHGTTIRHPASSC